MPRRVEPIRHSRVDGCDDDAKRPVGFEFGLSPIDRHAMVTIVERLHVAIPELDAPVRAARRSTLDDQRLVGSERERTETIDVVGSAPTGSRGAPRRRRQQHVRLRKRRDRREVERLADEGRDRAQTPSEPLVGEQRWRRLRRHALDLEHGGSRQTAVGEILANDHADGVGVELHVVRGAGPFVGRQRDLEFSAGAEHDVALRQVRDHSLGPLAVGLPAVHAKREVDVVAGNAADPVAPPAVDRREVVERVDVVAEDLLRRRRERRERGPSGVSFEIEIERVAEEMGQMAIALGDRQLALDGTRPGEKRLIRVT